VASVRQVWLLLQRRQQPLVLVRQVLLLLAASVRIPPEQMVAVLVPALEQQVHQKVLPLQRPMGQMLLGLPVF
jgi:hypothetical protein